jgi:uncharacterized protein YjiS (DUF1127 family)
MDLSQIAGSVSLHSGRPLRLENGYGRRIAVLEGHVWVTQDSDPRDVVVGAGQDFRFDRQAGAVASALNGDARIVFEDGIEAGDARGKGRKGFLAAVARLWNSFREARHAAQARASLRSLSDYTLADIGLQRSACGVTRHD